MLLLKLRKSQLSEEHFGRSFLNHQFSMTVDHTFHISHKQRVGELILVHRGSLILHALQ
jgi:hypothetical protein